MDYKDKKESKSLDLNEANENLASTQSSKTKENFNKINAESSSNKENSSAKEPKFRAVILGAKGLSLGISIIAAILLGIGIGILLQKIFDVFWVLWIGVFWGVAAAVLNVYKAYKSELREFDKISNDAKYSYKKDK
ncbi:MAG: AtpZ/AtpI family protein [Helicobacteraceae bacterium]|nr:AtpZ/AtpI family protein [Helicobacteraceae bacterium]